MSITTFSCSLEQFARQIVWYDSPEQRLTDIDAFLVFVMAKSVPSAYEHARAAFGFTDEDFRRALKRAKPGIFVYPAHWLKWNQQLGITPPLPFPERTWKDAGE